MALAAAETGAASVDRDQRDEDQVRLDRRMALRRLHDPERSRLERIAGKETKWLGGIGEAGESGDRPDGARFLHRWQWTDLRPERMVAGDHGYACEQRSEVLRQLMLEPSARGVRKRAHISLARVERRAAERFLRQRLQSGPRLRRIEGR